MELNLLCLKQQSNLIISTTTHNMSFNDYGNGLVTIEYQGAQNYDVIVIPDISGNMVIDSMPQTLTNKTIILSSTPPSTSSSVGVAGTITYDTNYIYMCTATNTWKRAALATF